MTVVFAVIFERILHSQICPKLSVLTVAIFPTFVQLKRKKRQTFKHVTVTNASERKQINGLKRVISDIFDYVASVEKSYTSVLDALLIPHFMKGNESKPYNIQL